MTFSDYVELISDSVAESGYDSFHPSLCAVHGRELLIKVLDGDIPESGDERAAMEWARQFTERAQTTTVAFRCGNRTVRVVELLGSDVVRVQHIKVDPYSAPAQDQ